MICVTDKKKCVGCGGCAAVCPRNCIVMAADAEGFAYPRVEETRCTDCGLCERVCPVTAGGGASDSPAPEFFAALACDTPMRLASSSGGMFSLLCRKVLAGGGVVFGAAFEQDFSVHHAAASTEAELAALRGSKYVQSDLGDTFRETKALLTQGKTVLYSGTGCQIAGLRAFLGRDYENLVCVDVLCHGVPSPMVWQKYLSEQEKQVRAVHFRVKEPSWRDYRFGFDFADGTACRVPREEDLYMALFLQNVSLRPSCSDCGFKGLHRLSDITLGDFWGVETCMPHMDDNRGTSVVLVHTEKGRKLLDAVRDAVTLEKVDGEKALPASSDARRSVKPHPRRARFFRMLSEGKSLRTAGRVLRPSVAERTVRIAGKVRGKIGALLSGGKA